MAVELVLQARGLEVARDAAQPVARGAQPRQVRRRTGAVAFRADQHRHDDRGEDGTEHQQWVRINLACSPEMVSQAVARMVTSLG